MKRFFKHISLTLVFVFMMVGYSYAYQTILSQKAGQIKYGMPLIDVVKLLGVPDWLVFQTDESDFASDIPPDMYKLVWKNENCHPIVVLVTSTGDTVAGWDAGRAGCEEGSSFQEFPENTFSLKNNDRYDFYKSKVVNFRVRIESLNDDLISDLEKERKRLDISRKLLEKDYAELNMERNDLIRFREALGQEPGEDMLSEYNDKLQGLNEKIEVYKADKFRYEQDLKAYKKKAALLDDSMN